MSNYYSTDEDYDRMKDDYMTGDYDRPVTRRQERENDAWRREQEYERRYS